MVATIRHAAVPEDWWDQFEPPVGLSAEIIQGELVLVPSPSMGHGFAQTRLLRALDAQLPDGHEIVQGIEWRLVVAGIVAAAPQPDLMVVRSDADPRVPGWAPLLAVEVLSPSDAEHLPQGVTRIEGKRLDYAANGLEHYLEVERVAGVSCARRYELRNGGLVVVDSAEGDESLAAEVPYPYEVVPARL